jgi:hypothetical protein
VPAVHRPAAIKNDKVAIGMRDDERHIVALPVATEAPYFLEHRASPNSS